MSRSSKSGVAIRESRIAAGVTQRELAERIGSAQSAISRIECGSISPTVATLERLLDAIGYDLELVPVKRSQHAPSEP